MRTELFDYALPDERIARHPLPERDGARLLVLGEQGVEHATVRQWPALVPRRALVVVNVSKVRHARVFGRRQGTLGKVEFLLLERIATSPSDERWIALGRANHPLNEGQSVDAEGLLVRVARVLGDGRLEVAVSGVANIEAHLAVHGHVPIPPYLRRRDDADDRKRYQTVFAKELGSVAAPTAGLHLTPALFEALRARDVDLGELILHVGLGTFRPISSDDLDDHVMHTESFEITEELARQVASARARGAPIVAVGTTVVRALESAVDAGQPGHVLAGRGETRLFVQPGYRFQVVDSLFTNFHQPRSTLLALVSAFAGRERVQGAYAEALECGYRFLSYGDAMWIPRRLGC